MRSRVRFFSPDGSSYSAASHCGPTRLAIWSKIDSYAPGHQARFGSLNYISDIRRDLIFDGFEPISGALHSHDEHDLDLPSDSVREIAPAAAPAINPEQIVAPKDGWMDPVTEAAHSSALEPKSVSSDPRTHLRP